MREKDEAMPSTLNCPRRALGALALVSCQLGPGTNTMVERRRPEQTPLILPAPRRDGKLSLEAALDRRRSIRSFTNEALTAEQIGQLVWAAQGITDPQGFRTAPSAGALYPLECYVATAAGVFHYEPGPHRLQPRVAEDLRAALAGAALNQSAIREAPAVVVITAVYERTALKYGEFRARRYAMLEAGHAAQNVLLEAVAIGLGAVPIGAFDDGRVARLLGLEDREAPLYLMPVGHPRP